LSVNNKNKTKDKKRIFGWVKKKRKEEKGRKKEKRV
jgi:hypothetical protein